MGKISFFLSENNFKLNFWEIAISRCQKSILPIRLNSNISTNKVDVIFLFKKIFQPRTTPAQFKIFQFKLSPSPILEFPRFSADTQNKSTNSSPLPNHYKNCYKIRNQIEPLGDLTLILFVFANTVVEKELGPVQRLFQAPDAAYSGPSALAPLHPPSV